MDILICILQVLFVVTDFSAVINTLESLFK